VGTARDGREALDLVEQLDPDVVTCDLIMPELDGVGFVREQMQRRPVPIIIMSVAKDTAEAALDALDAGAVDFVQKPTALASEKIFEVSAELIEKVKAAGRISLNRISTTPPQRSTEISEPETTVPGNHSVDMVVIGISTGGPQALKRLIPQLPEDFPVPVVMVMHMPVGYTEMYAAKLNELSHLEVREAAERDEVKPGRVFLAPAGRHLTLKRDASGNVVTHLDAKPFDMLHKPAVDVLFKSAAEVYGNRVLGVVMTGMGSDGKQGAAWIKSQGGLIFTEAESSCVVYGMPCTVVEAGLSDKSIALEDMAHAIREVV
jgi:two-component system chemotaxis response regulator CheB